MSRFKDLTDKVFGRLTVIDRVGNSVSGHSIWNCICSCGNRKKIRSSSLLQGDTQSCGCLMKEKVAEANTVHGLRYTRSYKTWQNMLDRCNNPDAQFYPNYGGRGIQVCESWHNFENFYKDMGEKPKGMSIERIRNNEGYNKDNCKWATAKEQGNNRRNNKHINFNGQIRTISQLAHEYGLDPSLVHQRLFKYKWSIERALNIK